MDEILDFSGNRKFTNNYIQRFACKIENDVRFLVSMLTNTALVWSDIFIYMRI